MTTLWRVGSVLLLALVLCDFDWASRAEGQVTAEKPLDSKGERQPVDYQPFFQQAWQKQGRKPVFYAWEGEKVVLLTSTADLDQKTIDVFLKRLDAAYTLCGDITGYSPQLRKQHKGKLTIAAIPDQSLMFNQETHWGFTLGGAEVSTFDGPNGDYERVRKTPEQFPTAYFQVITMNHLGLWQSCMAFTNGSDNVLRHLCVEDAKLKDEDAKTRQLLDQAADAYAKSSLSIGTSFPQWNNAKTVELKDSTGKPLPPTTLSVLLGSIALKLRQEHGGNDWLKRFYRHLSASPQALGADQAVLTAQLLNFTIAASLASQSEPSKDFQTRWRFPSDPAVWAALKKVDWKKPGLTPMDVIDALPSEHVLPSIIQLRPSFLTPERRKQNLLVASDFEGDAAKNWRPFSWRLNGPYAGAKLQSEVVKEGRQALHIKTTESDDIRFEQTVKLQPGTRYMLSGWIKTKDVTFDTKADQTYRRAAASLSIWGGYEHTQLIVGTNDWQYVTLTFDSNTRSEVSIGARLGYWYSIAHGEAWFDDLCLIPLGPSPVRPTTLTPPSTASNTPAIVTNKDWQGWSKDAPAPAIAPFNAVQAKLHQEAWAKHLGVPVEYTNSIGMKFRLIPPGEYLRGCTPEEIAADVKAIDAYWGRFVPSSGPQHKVTITQPFYVGVYEVTQDSYSRVMGSNPAHFAPTGLGRAFVAGRDTSTHPVERVSWTDAADFCARLSTIEKLQPCYIRAGDVVTLRTGNGYRLPTEAEWELACRAGTTTSFWNGNSVDQYALVGRNYSNKALAKTHPVGELKPNPFGLFDIHGNVWEYAQDNWSATTYRQLLAGGNAIDPICLPTGNALRAIRGGSCMDVPTTSTSGSHLAHGPTDRNFTNVGFRATLSVDAVKAVGKPVLAEMPLEAEVPRQSSNDQSAVTLKGSPFTSVAYSPDGEWIATAAINRSVTLWDAEKAQPVRTLDGGWCVAFSPDSQQLASAGPANSVRVWNVTSGTELKTLNGHTGDVRSVAYNRDGTQIASAGADKTVRLWDAQTGQLLKTFEGHTDDVRAVVFSSDGMRLVSGSKDTSVRVWPLDKRRDRPVLRGHTGEVRSVAIADNETQTIFSAGHDGTTRHWLGMNGNEGGLLRTDGLHASGVMSLALSPDKKWIATASSDRLIKISSAAIGVERISLPGHTSQVTGIAWHPNGKRVASVSYDGTLKLWNVADGLSRGTSTALGTPSLTREIAAEESQLIEEAAKTAWPLTNGNLADGLNGWTLDDGAKQFRLFKIPGTQQTALTTAGTPTDASTGRLYQCFKVPADATELRFFLHGGADSQGTYVALWKGMNEVRRAAGRNDNAPINIAWNIESLRGQVVTLEIVDQSTAPWGFIGVHGFELVTQQNAAGSPRKLKTRVTRATQDDPQTFSLHGHAYPVVGVAASPNGKLLASGDLEGTVLVWDVATRALKFEVPKKDTSNAIGLAFSPDGKLLASALGRLIRIYDATNGSELRALTGHSDLIYRVAFSPDGTFMASASHDKSVKVWDVAQGQAVTTLTGPDQAFLAPAFSPDGKWLAAGSYLGGMIWSTTDWKLSQRVGSTDGATFGVAFSPDSQRLVTTSHSERATVWDIASGDELLELQHRTRPRSPNYRQEDLERQIKHAAYHPDGSRIATGAESGTVNIWDARTSRLLHSLKAHQKAARGVVFDPHGKWLATGGGDHLVKVWTLAGLAKAESTDDTIVRSLVDAKAVAAEVKSLQGTWQMTNVADTGFKRADGSPFKDVVLVINGETAMLLAGDMAIGLALTLDPSRAPKAVDLRAIDDKSAQWLWKGSYKLDGDSLVVIGQDARQVRPIEFDQQKAAAPKNDSTHHETNYSPFKFERVKAPLPQMEPIFDLPAWQTASKQLRRLNVRSIVRNTNQDRDLGIHIPPYVGNLDLGPAMKDGVVPEDVWKSVLSINVVACAVTKPSDATLQQLSTHPGLSGLTLQGPSTVTKDGVALLKNCPQLVSLSFNECPQAIDILNALPETTDLRILRLQETTASSAGFAAIARCRNLEVLHLSEIDLSDEIAMEISKLTNLKLLSSQKVKRSNDDKPELSDKGLQALEKMPKLMSVELHGHGLDNLKVQELREKLRARR